MNGAVSFKLYPKQMKVLTSRATEILYGGAAGGGKSYLMRVLAILICLEVENATIYIFRRLFKELLANHVYGPTGFLTLLKPLMDDGLVVYNKSEQYFLFTETGSRIWLAHCQFEDDVLSYLGADFHVLLIDEASQFTEKMLRFLRSRVRLGALQVPEKWKGILPKIVYGTNPRGPAHGYLKRGFVDISQGVDHQWIAPMDDGGMIRQFIPALYTDNLVQMQNDPGYLGRLRGLGTKELTDAYEKGDWAIREDAIFGGDYDESTHLIEPFTLPREWQIFRGYDHGSSAPASALWWAETNGEEVLLPTGKVLSPPPKSIIFTSELYLGTSDEKGLNLDPAEIGRRMKNHEAERYRSVLPGPADNSIFDAAPGFSSVASLMSPYVRFTRSDKTSGSRKRGVTFARQMMRNRTQRRQEPWLLIFKDCVRLNAHIKNLPRDEEDPDDVSSLAVDHDWDVMRYALLKSRTRVRALEVEGT